MRATSDIMRATQISAAVETRLVPAAVTRTRACLPPAANARRRRFADIRVTLKRRAASRSLASASIKSATANRTGTAAP